MKKRYIINAAIGNKDSKMQLSEDEFNQWVSLHAAANYSVYRIIGDRRSNHFYIDFEEMYEVSVKYID